MFWLPLLLQAGSTALNIAGGLEQANAAADQARRNAALADSQAADAYRLGAWRVGMLRARGSQVTGAERAGYAASGVDVTQGTPLQTMAGTRFMSDLDIQTAHNNAARQAWGFKQQAGMYRRQAELDSQAGVFGAIGAGMGGVGSLLGSYGSSAAQQTPNIAADPSSYTGNRLRTPAGGYY